MNSRIDPAVQAKPVRQAELEGPQQAAAPVPPPDSMAAPSIATAKRDAPAVRPLEPTGSGRIARLALLEQQTELAKYFGIRDIGRIASRLSSAGLELTPALAYYRDYIALQLTPEGGATGKTATLIENVRTLIGRRITDALGDDGNANKWVINERLQEAMSRVAQPLLSSAKFYIQMTTDPDYRRELEGLPEYTNDPMFRAYVTGVLQRVDEEMIAQVPRDIPSGLLANPSFFDPNGTDKLLYARRLIARDPQLAEFADRPGPLSPTLESPSFLSTADRTVDQRAKLTLMAAYLLQAVPYVGAGPSAVLDAENVVSSSDATAARLKSVGLLPSDYEVDKGLVDHLTSVVGLAGSLVGLQGVAKTGKLSRLARRLRHVDPKELEAAAEAVRAKIMPEARVDRAVALFKAADAETTNWDRVDELRSAIAHQPREMAAFVETLTPRQKSALTNGVVPPELADTLNALTKRHATEALPTLRAMGFDADIVKVGSAGGYGVRIEQKTNRFWRRLRGSPGLKDAQIVYAPFMLRMAGAGMGKIGRNVVVGDWATIEELVHGRYGMAMRHELHHMKLGADLAAGRKTPFQASIVATPGSSLGLDIYDHHFSLEEISTYFRDIREHLWLRTVEQNTGDPRLAEFASHPTGAIRTFNTLSRRSLEIIGRSTRWLDAEVAKGTAGMAPTFRIRDGRTMTSLPVLDDAGRCVGNFEIHLVESRGVSDPENLRLLRSYLNEMTEAITSRRRRLAPYLQADA